MPNFVADSVETTGLKWVAPAGGGKVLQVLQNTKTTSTSTTNTSYTDSGLSQTITPSSATSKILVLVASKNRAYGEDGTPSVNFRIVRDATELAVALFQSTVATSAAEDYMEFEDLASMCYLDSPNTTSAITYKLQMKVSGDPNESVSVSAGSSFSSLTVFEIGA